jgi:hypothetical protein
MIQEQTEMIAALENRLLSTERAEYSEKATREGPVDPDEAAVFEHASNIGHTNPDGIGGSS